MTQMLKLAEKCTKTIITTSFFIFKILSRNIADIFKKPCQSLRTKTIMSKILYTYWNGLTVDQKISMNVTILQ